VTGGLAYGGLGVSSLVFGTTENDTKIGWTVGGGIEHALFGAWSVKAEYLYFELDSMNCGTLVCGAEMGVKFKGNLVRLGTNFRF
jgi:outer membrane immunogenic protein